MADSTTALHRACELAGVEHRPFKIEEIVAELGEQGFMIVPLNALHDAFVEGEGANEDFHHGHGFTTNPYPDGPTSLASITVNDPLGGVTVYTFNARHLFEYAAARVRVVHRSDTGPQAALS